MQRACRTRCSDQIQMLDCTMGAETNLSPPPLELEILRGEDQVRGSKFGRFLSEPLELGGGAMEQLPVGPPATMGPVQSSPAAELDLSVQGKLSVPVAAVGARSASSNCGDMCIGGSRSTESCNPAAARSSGSAAHMGGSELYVHQQLPM
ncbi:hypothetical protein ACQJBY_008019 [Aegilops geniculata]